MVVLDRPLSTFSANYNTIIMVIKLQRKPTIGIVNLPKNGIDAPVTIIIPTPKDAPEDKPKVYGEAN